MGWAGLGRVQPDETDLAGLGQFGPNAFFPPFALVGP